MVGCDTKYQMSRCPEHKHRLSSTDFALIQWEIGPHLITFEKKHPVVGCCIFQFNCTVEIEMSGGGGVLWRNCEIVNVLSA